MKCTMTIIVFVQWDFLLIAVMSFLAWGEENPPVKRGELGWSAGITSMLLISSR